MKIIPVGYGNQKHRELIPALMQDPDTVLVSVCHSDRAALYTWSVANLTKRYGEQFRWIPSLGNIHYKHPEFGIQIADLDTGLSDVYDLLLLGKTALIMCGCGTMEPTKKHPHGCHRRIICDALVARYAGVEIVLPETIFTDGTINAHEAGVTTR
jgi:hypothetical protein